MLVILVQATALRTTWESIYRSQLSMELLLRRRMLLDESRRLSLLLGRIIPQSRINLMVVSRMERKLVLAYQSAPLC